MSPTLSNGNFLFGHPRHGALVPHPASLHFFGVVLGGGKSRRMQFDKRFLKLNGEYLVDRAARILSESLGQPVAAILLSGVIPGRQAIPDLLPDLGPLGGVHAVLSHLSASNETPKDPETDPIKASWAIFLPVDMPYLSAVLLQKLLSAVAVGSAESQELEAVHFQGAQLPLCLRVSTKILDHIESRLRALDPRERSLKALVSSLSLKKVSLEEEDWSLLANFNTPQDLPPEATR